MRNLPDLLNYRSKTPQNTKFLIKELAFAFVSGDSGGALRKNLDQATVGASSWQPESFVKDLFIDELVDVCFKFNIKDVKETPSYSYIKRVLCAPPDDMQTVLFRQGILQELSENPSLLNRLKLAYAQLVDLRTLLDSTSFLGRSYSARRRIDILVEIKESVDLLAGGFKQVNSGLSRIGAWAKAFQDSAGYKTLAEFLDFEDNLANVQLHMRVGSNGSIRAFKIVSIEENKKNAFFAGPVSRFLARMRLWGRGYSVSNAELIERWVDSVFDGVKEYLVYFLQLIGDMEFYFAALAFRQLCQSKKLDVCFPVFADEHAALKDGVGTLTKTEPMQKGFVAENGVGKSVAKLFNPLLLSGDKVPITCTVKTHRIDPVVIVTGPNSGGKTRLLQALGIMQLFAQSGIWVPAESATIRFASSLFVSLLEGTCADQKEGRLGMELLRVRQLFEKSKPGVLILLDELCSGTNPSEGEEIFLLVTSLLRELKPEAFISTHFLRLAQKMSEEQKAMDLEFVQVELDNNQVPTYGFVQGVARTSLAKYTAKRLGVTGADLMALIKKNCNS